MDDNRTVHCDKVRITIKVPSRIPNADLVLRVDAEDGELKGRNYCGLDVRVGHANLFARPYGPREADATHLTIDGNPSKMDSTWGLYDERFPFHAIKELCQQTCKALKIPFDAA